MMDDVGWIFRWAQSFCDHHLGIVLHIGPGQSVSAFGTPCFSTILLNFNQAALTLR